MKKYDFFMRFYTSKEMVESVLQEMRQYHPFFDYTIYPATMSCNFFVPNEAWQVDFQFETEDERDRFRKDVKIQELYLTVAPQGAVLKERKPRDEAYAIGGST